MVDHPNTSKTWLILRAAAIAQAATACSHR